MHVVLDLCVIPIGEGVSLSEPVSVCVRILQQAGLAPRTHAYGTNVEGEWDAVFAAVKRCHETLHEMGIARISTTAKFGTRTDRLQTIDDKVGSVSRRLAGD